MHSKRFLIILVLIISIVSFVPRICLGFTSDIRTSIIADAIKFCPDGLRTYLEKHQETVIEGSFFVDRNPRALRKDSLYVRNSYAKIIEGLGSGKSDERNIINQFGILAGFLLESIYRGDATDRVNTVVQDCPEIVRYDGLHELTDIDSRMTKLLKRYKPYWGDTREDAKDYLYNVGVNELVDFWVSAWRAGGQQVTRLCEIGSTIKHPAQKPTNIHRPSRNYKNSQSRSSTPPPSTTLPNFPEPRPTTPP
jgi:hypothetical protein